MRYETPIKYVYINLRILIVYIFYMHFANTFFLLYLNLWVLHNVICTHTFLNGTLFTDFLKTPIFYSTGNIEGVSVRFCWCYMIDSICPILNVKTVMYLLEHCQAGNLMMMLQALEL